MGICESDVREGLWNAQHRMLAGAVPVCVSRAWPACSV